MFEKPRHRRPTPLISKVAAITLVGCGLITAGNVVKYAKTKYELARETRCSVVANYPEQIPQADVNYDVIQKQLGLTALQLRRVHMYAATCHVPVTSEEFAAGVKADAAAYNDLLGTNYESCVLYGIPDKLVPADEDKNIPAVLACAAPPANQHIVQI